MFILKNMSAFANVIHGYHEFFPFFKENVENMISGGMFKEDVHFYWQI